jgi:hypothetical protein
MKDDYSQFVLFLLFINYVANFLVVLLFAHPQINNRMLTCNPLLYIYCVDEIFKRSKKREFIFAFFAFFSVLSCLMQSGSYGFA